MRLAATNLSLPFNADESALMMLLASELRVKQEDIQSLRITRHSLDARDKADIRSIYSVSFELSTENAKRVALLGLKNVGKLPERSEREPEQGTVPQDAPAVVVGLGPAGLFAAHELAKRGYKVIVIERGKPIAERKADVETFFSQGLLNTNSNVMFGEGGAGTFSDGKLTTRIKDPRAEDVIDTLVKFGADGNIAVEAKPHIGTDVLSHVVADMRKALQSMGVEIRFNSCMTDFDTRDGRIVSVTVNGKEKLPCCAAVLAIGQAARDTYRLLVSKGIELVPKPFAVGVRIEHPQDFINRSQFGRFAGHPRLGAAEYRLTGKSGSRGVYTFCMCPGGQVCAAASEDGGVVTNGMSYHARDGRNANAAVVVSVDGRDFDNDPVKAVAFQRQLEQAAYRAGGGGYLAPAETVGSFLAGRGKLELGAVQPTYPRGVTPCDLGSLLPGELAADLRDGITAFGRKLRAYQAPDAVLTGLETRTSSPVRLLRGDNFQCTGLTGLYPCGEGAGYAGGIMTAAVDGVRCAAALMQQYAPDKA